MRTRKDGMFETRLSAALVDGLDVTEVPPPFARFENFE